MRGEQALWETFLTQLFPKREQEKALRADGYTGNSRFLMIHQKLGAAHVYAPTGAAAIWTVAKAWGMNPKQEAIHQAFSARKC